MLVSYMPLGPENSDLPNSLGLPLDGYETSVSEHPCTRLSRWTRGSLSTGTCGSCKTSVSLNQQIQQQQIYMAARLVQAGLLVGGSVGAAITIRGCVKATQPAERCIYCGGAAVGAALTGGYAYFHSDYYYCLLYTSPSPRDQRGSRMPSSA